MGISILEALDSLATGEEGSGLQVAFAATYNANLQFFERLVMPKLQRLGVSSVGVLADRQAYQSSLSDPIRPEQCGRTYVMGYSPWLRGLQHGKLLWLHGDQDIVFVGSHNLTRSGFNDSLETTVRLDSRDPKQLPAIRSAHVAISALVEGAGALSRIWGRVPEPPTTDSEPTVDFLWSGHGGLMDQLRRLTGSAKRIRVITPFLDARALRRLCIAFSAEEVILDLPFDGADTPLDAALACTPNVIARTVNRPNQLHGKAYELTTEDATWLAIGSANCTNAGIVHGIREGGNSEFLAVFRSEPLEDERVEFSVVENPAEFAGTGRRWDESGPPNCKGITYFSAMYEDRILSAEWKCDGRLTNLRLGIGGEELGLGESPSRVPMEDAPPQRLTLFAQLNGEDVTADTWVTFFDDLALYASGVSAGRRRAYLEFADPMKQVLGIEFEILQLVRSLGRPTTDTLQIAEQAGKRLQPEETDRAVTVFEFSPDPDEITKRAASLIVGDNSTDPLALIRGLIARVTGPVPHDYQRDEESTEGYHRKRERALRRISRALISHLGRLSRIDRHQWCATPHERIKLCLQGTFEVVVVIWAKVLRRDSAKWQQFAEAMLGVVTGLTQSDLHRAISQSTEVAGPLVLAIAAAGEAAAEEHERDLLRECLASLYGSEYRSRVEAWAKSYAVRATMIGRVQGERDTWSGIEARLAAADRLMGIASKGLVSRQRQKWGPLLEFLEATRECSPGAGRIREQAEAAFGDNPVWRKCVSSVDAGRPPAVLRVDRPSCSGCFLSLPVRDQLDLQRGEVILCPNCGAMLIFGKL